jgi:hypothetical protein
MSATREPECGGIINIIDYPAMNIAEKRIIVSHIAASKAKHPHSSKTSNTMHPVLDTMNTAYHDTAAEGGRGNRKLEHTLEKASSTPKAA